MLERHFAMGLSLVSVVLVIASGCGNAEVDSGGLCPSCDGDTASGA